MNEFGNIYIGLSSASSRYTITTSGWTGISVYNEKGILYLVPFDLDSLKNVFDTSFHEIESGYEIEEYFAERGIFCFPVLKKSFELTGRLTNKDLISLGLLNEPIKKEPLYGENFF